MIQVLKLHKFRCAETGVLAVMREVLGFMNYYFNELADPSSH
jgi:hypothetical protein